MQRLNNIELRLGNKVMIDGQICTVDNLYADYIGTKEFPSILDRQAKQVYGLALSPEVLGWCGFDNYDTDPEEPDYDYRMYVNSALNRVFIGWIKEASAAMLIDGDHSRVGPPIKYLHQLQNIFYSLTGEELTISLPTVKFEK